MNQHGAPSDSTEMQTESVPLTFDAAHNQPSSEWSRDQTNKEFEWRTTAWGKLLLKECLQFYGVKIVSQPVTSMDYHNIDLVGLLITIRLITINVTKNHQNILHNRHGWVMTDSSSKVFNELEWGSTIKCTIKSPWVRTVTSRYSSCYDLRCC